MSGEALKIGTRVTIDVGNPGTVGFRSAQQGTVVGIIGYVVKWDNAPKYADSDKNYANCYVLLNAAYDPEHSTHAVFTAQSAHGKTQSLGMS